MEAVSLKPFESRNCAAPSKSAQSWDKHTEQSNSQSGSRHQARPTPTGHKTAQQKSRTPCSPTSSCVRHRQVQGSGGLCRRPARASRSESPSRRCCRVAGDQSWPGRLSVRWLNVDLNELRESEEYTLATWMEVRAPPTCGNALLELSRTLVSRRKWTRLVYVAFPPARKRRRVPVWRSYVGAYFSDMLVAEPYIRRSCHFSPFAVRSAWTAGERSHSKKSAEDDQPSEGTSRKVSRRTPPIQPRKHRTVKAIRRLSSSCSSGEPRKSPPPATRARRPAAG